MPLVLTEVTDAVATIRLNRPEKLNSFAGTMREELLESIVAAAGNPAVRVIVLTGEGRGFCAGGDVDTMSRLQQEGDTESFMKLLDWGRRIVSAIRVAGSPVIASINGVAAGAGCNLALACDYRIASTTAKLGQTFVRIGLHPDWGGTWLLPRLVGTSRAMEIMLTGRLVAAEEALAIGMVDKVVPAEELANETGRLAASIAAGPPLVARAIKSALYRSAGHTLDEQLDLEASNQLAAFRSADSAEGMRAFFEKRSPKFSGS